MAGRLSLAEQEAAGVDSYYAAGATKTKANTTLFVAWRDATVSVPPPERASKAEGIFSGQPGYIGVRAVRSMCFVDFDSIKAATAAMMRFQGTMGLTIDYDKDQGVATKRKRQTDQSTSRAKHEASSGSYYCCGCGTKALRTNGTLLSDMPARGTDGARVVDEVSGQQLAQLLLEPSATESPTLVKREKGKERQYRLVCRSCGQAIAYRSVPLPAEGKFLYVWPTAVRERPPTQEELHRAKIAREHQEREEPCSEGSATLGNAPPGEAATEGGEQGGVSAGNDY
jgi:hypothetical protein